MKESATQFLVVLDCFAIACGEVDRIDTDESLVVECVPHVKRHGQAAGLNCSRPFGYSVKMVGRLLAISSKIATSSAPVAAW